jgi:hypothetical protein
LSLSGTRDPKIDGNASVDYCLARERNKKQLACQTAKIRRKVAVKRTGFLKAERQTEPTVRAEWTVAARSALLVAAGAALVIVAVADAAAAGDSN